MLGTHVAGHVLSGHAAVWLQGFALHVEQFIVIGEQTSTEEGVST